MEGEAPITNKLWQSREVILDILEDRGYQLEKNDHTSLEEFIKHFEGPDERETRENIKIVRSMIRKKSSRRIIVFWIKEKFGGADVTGICNEMSDKDVKRAIVVTDLGATPQVKPTLRMLRSQGIYIDIYTLQESQINIMKHSYVPKHKVCSKKEKEKIMKLYAVTPDKLPHIKPTDVVVRHFGAKKGQLFKITRPSETMPGYETISYRLVS